MLGQDRGAPFLLERAAPGLQPAGTMAARPARASRDATQPVYPIGVYFHLGQQTTGNFQMPRQGYLTGGTGKYAGIKGVRDNVLRVGHAHCRRGLVVVRYQLDRETEPLEGPLQVLDRELDAELERLAGGRERAGERALRRDLDDARGLGPGIPAIRMMEHNQR